MCKLTKLSSLKKVKKSYKGSVEPTVTEHHSQVVVQRDSHGMESFCSSPKN